MASPNCHDFFPQLSEEQRTNILRSSVRSDGTFDFSWYPANRFDVASAPGTTDDSIFDFGSSAMSSETFEQESFAGLLNTPSLSIPVIPPLTPSTSFEPSQFDSSSSGFPSFDEQGAPANYTIPSSQSMATNAAFTPGITEVDRNESAVLGLLADLPGLEPFTVQQLKDALLQALQRQVEGQHVAQSPFAIPAQTTTQVQLSMPMPTAASPPTQPSTSSSNSQVLPVQVPWDPDHDRINPGPFAFADVFGMITPHLLAGKMRQASATGTGAGPGTDIRPKYSTRPYGPLNMVRQEQGGQYAVQLFRRIWGTGAIIQLGSEVLLPHEEVFQYGPDPLMWQQVSKTSPSGKQAHYELRCRVEELRNGIKLPLGSRGQRDYTINYGMEQKRVILICRLVFPDYTTMWSTMLSIDGKEIRINEVDFAMI